MKPASLAAALVLGLVLSACSSPSFAEESRFVGSWVLDSVKSKAPLIPGTATLAISDLGGGKYKTVSDTTVAGETAHSEVTFAIDGKDYVAQTTPTLPGGAQITQSFEKAGDGGYKNTLKVSGQVVATTVAEVSADGKTLTLTTTAAADPSTSTMLVFTRK